MIFDFAMERGLRPNMLVETNIGNERCGVEPLQETLDFTRKIRKLPGLDFKGLMGCDEHQGFAKDLDEQFSKSIEVYQILVQIKDLLEQFAWQDC